MADNPKKLNKTIEIDGIPYDVTATEANKVEKQLILKPTNFDGTATSDESRWKVFDGSNKVELDIVPASGGGFKGQIRVPNVEDSGNKLVEGTVLNYGDITKTVLTTLLNTSVLYNWDGTSVDFTTENGFNSISIIFGSKKNLSSFVSYNHNKYENYKNNQNNRYLYVSTYLYICSDEDKHDIYLGTCDSLQVTKIAGNADMAEEAKKLAKTSSITINLEQNSWNTQFTGDGTAVTLGVSGVLQPAQGGTGKAELSDVEVGKANKAGALANKNELIVNLSSGFSADFYGGGTEKDDPLKIGVEGILPVGKGGTGVAQLSNLKNVGSALSANKLTAKYIAGTTASYTLSEKDIKITVSALTPNEVGNIPGWTPSEGDIWIKY